MSSSPRRAGDEDGIQQNGVVQAWREKSMKNRFHKIKQSGSYDTPYDDRGCSYRQDWVSFTIIDKITRKKIWSYGDKEIVQQMVDLLNKYTRKR